MTAQELAALIDGHEVGNETDKSISEAAKAHGLVIVYGYSDDNIELEGAIREEVGAYNGTTICITSEGSIRKRWEFIDRSDEDEAETYFKAKALPFKTICCDWSPDDDTAYWVLTTDMPHAKFNIMEHGGAVFCRGIVFSLKELAV